MAEEQTLYSALGDIAQYFIDCRANAAKGSAAERRFTVFIDVVSAARKSLEKPAMVLTKDDVVNTGYQDVTCYIEVKGCDGLYGAYMHKKDADHTEIMCDVPNTPELLVSGNARLWNFRPTDEQRKATPWEKE